MQRKAMHQCCSKFYLMLKCSVTTEYITLVICMLTTFQVVYCKVVVLDCIIILMGTPVNTFLIKLGDSKETDLKYQNSENM